MQLQTTTNQRRVMGRPNLQGSPYWMRLWFLYTVRKTSPRGTLSRDWDMPAGTNQDESGEYYDMLWITRGHRESDLLLVCEWLFGNGGAVYEDMYTANGAFLSAYRPLKADYRKIAFRHGLTTAVARRRVERILREVDDAEWKYVRKALHAKTIS